MTTRRDFLKTAAAVPILSLNAREMPIGNAQGALEHRGKPVAADTAVHGAAVQLGAVQLRDRLFSAIVAHFNKTETLGPTSVPISDHFDRRFQTEFVTCVTTLNDARGITLSNERVLSSHARRHEAHSRCAHPH